MKNLFTKVFFDKLLIVIGSFLMLYHILLRIAVGFISFSRAFFILGLLLFVYGIIEIKYNISIWKSINKSIRCLISTIFFICLIIFFIIEGIIIYNGHHYDNDTPDYVMVLGAGLRGTKLSLALKDRLDTAIEFNKIHPDVKIIVSGGQGEGEDISEALAMKKYLMNNGIGEDLIICEDKSTNTYENFLFTKELLDKNGHNNDYKITVISNNFHMYRAKLLGKEVGFQCLGYPAPSHPSTTVIFHIREFFGVIKAYIFKH